MKILVIMKRFSANIDMVMQDFGREIRLFEPLAKKHEIDFFCPDYKKKESKTLIRKGIRFIITPISFFSIPGFLNTLKKQIKTGNYDLIVATMDPLVGIIGNYYSKKFNIPWVYDLQDNFEIYHSYKIPFVGSLDRKAVKNADIVLAVSKNLKKYISKIRTRPVHIIENGVNLSLFKKISKDKARSKLKLPKKAKIIVYVGSISKINGADIMLNVFEEVRKEMPEAYLLLAGKVSKNLNIKKENIILMKFKKRDGVALALNASDVAMLPKHVDNFSPYCFPYKLMEYMACGLPIVATDIGDVSIVLKNYEGSLVNPDNIEEYKNRIISKLKKPRRIDYSKDVKNFTWETLAKKIDKIITAN
ncbi:MAG TPA: glycosyltransferase family 4 protein [Candidatus Woesearchaeota archaeon]|jgi:glycosyltransferase involved in cell wall biosynthesis|nr:glycosyltransferase family 4 protein [Candidatus Woesearchaeota archaeon]|tara:strand:- start:425 stop:1507 length:1083 start_codon:yes stop_codon:yes gene_type:complete